MPIIVKDWKCSKCGTEWVNTITVKKLPKGQRGKDALITCPKCGNNAFQTAGFDEEVVRVKSKPKNP